MGLSGTMLGGSGTAWKRRIHVAPSMIKMVVFDMDGVLVNIDSSWRAVHRAFGVDNEKNYQRFMRGEIDFKEFMRSDIRLWGDAHISDVKGILDRAPLMKGADEAVRKLKRAGYRTAIISSGISILADRVRSQLGIDLSFSNILLSFGDGKLSGEGEEVVGLNDKLHVFRRLASMKGLTTKQCAVVGDSVFDKPLFEEAGFSIAFNAEDEGVKGAADVVVEDKDLRKILPYFT